MPCIRMMSLWLWISLYLWTVPVCYSLCINRRSPAPTRVPLSPPGKYSWLSLVGICPGSSVAIMIMGWDSATQITKYKLLSSVQRPVQHQNTMVIIYISHKWPHLTGFLKKKKKEEKRAFLLLHWKCENDHLYNTASALNIDMPTM